jgi:PAS domain-containing protein
VQADSQQVTTVSWLLVLGGAALFAASDTVYLVHSAEGVYRQGILVAAARVRSVLRELDGLETERRMRQQAEEPARQLALQEAENRTLTTRLAGLLDAAPVGIVEIDTDGRVRRWNRAAERIHGWSEEEVLGRPDPNPATPSRSGQTVTHQNRDGGRLRGRVRRGRTGRPGSPRGCAQGGQRRQ